MSEVTTPPTERKIFPRNTKIKIVKEFPAIAKTETQMLRVRVVYSDDHQMPRLDLRWYEPNGRGYVAGVSLTIPQMKLLADVIPQAIEVINQELASRKENSK